MYNDEFDRINGEYRYNRTSNLPRDDYRPQYNPVVPESPKKKGNMTVKVIALVLVCAIVGGLCGFSGFRQTARGGRLAARQAQGLPKRKALSPVRFCVRVSLAVANSSPMKPILISQVRIANFLFSFCCSFGLALRRSFAIWLIARQS